MLSIRPTSTSPKIIIDFKEVLFEVSGVSTLENAELFYQPVLKYIADNFFEVSRSTYYRGAPSISLHFYLSETGEDDLKALQEIDDFMHRIGEFSTYVIWYYNPYKPATVEMAKRVEQTFKNPVRLIENSVHV